MEGRLLFTTLRYIRTVKHIYYIDIPIESLNKLMVFSLLLGCSPLFLELFLAQRLKKVFEARAFLVIASGQKHFRILMYPSNGKYGVIYGLVVQRIYFHALYYMYLLHFYFMQKKNFTGI